MSGGQWIKVRERKTQRSRRIGEGKKWGGKGRRNRKAEGWREKGGKGGNIKEASGI